MIQLTQVFLFIFLSASFFLHSTCFSASSTELLDRCQAEWHWNQNNPRALQRLFIISIRNGVDGCVRFFLDKNVSPSQEAEIEERRYTPLSAAVERGRLDLIELLVDHGANLNEKDEQGLSLLAKAIEFNQWELFHLLIKKGLSIEGRGLDQKSLAHVAAFFGRTEFLEFFLKLKPIEYWESGCDQNLLHSVAEGGHFFAAQNLIEHMPLSVLQKKLIHKNKSGLIALEVAFVSQDGLKVSVGNIQLEDRAKIARLFLSKMPSFEIKRLTEVAGPDSISFFKKVLAQGNFYAFSLFKNKFIKEQVSADLGWKYSRDPEFFFKLIQAGLRVSDFSFDQAKKAGAFQMNDEVVHELFESYWKSFWSQILEFALLHSFYDLEFPKDEFQIYQKILANAQKVFRFSNGKIELESQEIISLLKYPHTEDFKKKLLIFITEKKIQSILNVSAYDLRDLIVSLRPLIWRAHSSTNFLDKKVIESVFWLIAGNKKIQSHESLSAFLTKEIVNALGFDSSHDVLRKVFWDRKIIDGTELETASNDFAPVPYEYFHRKIVDQAEYRRFKFNLKKDFSKIIESFSSELVLKESYFESFTFLIKSLNLKFSSDDLNFVRAEYSDLMSHFAWAQKYPNYYLLKFFKAVEQKSEQNFAASGGAAQIFADADLSEKMNQVLVLAQNPIVDIELYSSFFLIFLKKRFLSKTEISHHFIESFFSELRGHGKNPVVAKNGLEGFNLYLQYFDQYHRLEENKEYDSLESKLFISQLLALSFGLKSKISLDEFFVFLERLEQPMHADLRSHLFDGLLRFWIGNPSGVFYFDNPLLNLPTLRVSFSGVFGRQMGASSKLNRGFLFKIRKKAGFKIWKAFLKSKLDSTDYWQSRYFQNDDRSPQTLRSLLIENGFSAELALLESTDDA